MGKMIGKKGLINQLLEERAKATTTRCEDASGAPGYTGDLEIDLRSTE